MIKVELLGLTMLEEESGKKEVACGKELEALMSFAAYGCYEGERPHIGKVINLKNRIFDTGHQQSAILPLDCILRIRFIIPASDQAGFVPVCFPSPILRLWQTIFMRTGQH
ncbi:MAG: hypothetical protein US61_C0021G0003 [Parcubacteria group bacterium GW2011_GWE2_37_8]|nr:MAG: hypothetical protein US61_C0021G0003 [Parcubacteria group bacterium GW2011_GWE2_37_8]